MLYDTSNMKLKNNYHNTSIQYEDEFEEAIKHYTDILIASLSALDPLTELSIDIHVEQWRHKYYKDISEIIKIQVLRTYKYAEDVIPNKEEQDLPESLSVFLSQSDIEKYINATKQELEKTISYIREEFIQIGIQENVYNIDEDRASLMITSIVSATDNKVRIFAGQSTTNNLRAFIFENAKELGYTQYKWRTCRDNRVRPTHARMDDKWVDIDHAPSETNYCHVGQDWGCRCFASAFR